MSNQTSPQGELVFRTCLNDGMNSAHVILMPQSCYKLNGAELHYTYQAPSLASFKEFLKARKPWHTRIGMKDSPTSTNDK